ncbi:MAG: phage tail sheath family protein, partial [Selenomonadaceae bacterium]|nr:phage tail sheath family protein [Selenomonadaceae bacterium]
MPIDIGFKHGIYVNELPTPIVPLTQITQPTVAFGTAPVHLAANPAGSNTPILCSTLAEFVDQFGWSDDFDSYTLCEVAKAHFTLYNVAPVVFVNVLDPLKHAAQKTAEVEGLSVPITLNKPVIAASVVVKTGTGDGEVTLAVTDDYSAAYDSDGNTVITLTAAGLSKIVDDKAVVTYREIDASAVTASTIIGGVDQMTGANTGLECLEDVYPKLGVVPGTVIAPKFSTDAALALVMANKCNGINGCFK